MSTAQWLVYYKGKVLIIQADIVQPTVIAIFVSPSKFHGILGISLKKSVCDTSWETNSIF